MAAKVPLEARRKYDVGRELASGKFGVVYTCVSKATMEPLAIKVMRKLNNKRDDVVREVDILRKLTYPGILEMTDFMETDKEFILVTELLNGGELFDYVLEKEYLEEKEATHYMRQILNAMGYCHKNSIVHLDLKPENIVLKEKDGNIIKIIDFGCARNLSITPRPQVMGGTPEFVAPEVLNFDPVSSACDMWSIGVITYVLLTGMSPFLGDSDGETVTNIATGEFDYPDPDPEESYEDISDTAKCFIDNLLIMSPEKRPNCQTCLSHEWLTCSNSHRIGTNRLKSFRARRRWLAITRATRLSISLCRLASLTSKRSSSDSVDTCQLSPDLGDDEVIESS